MPNFAKYQVHLSLIVFHYCLLDVEPSSDHWSGNIDCLVDCDLGMVKKILDSCYVSGLMWKTWLFLLGQGSNSCESCLCERVITVS